MSSQEPYTPLPLDHGRVRRRLDNVRARTLPWRAKALRLRDGILSLLLRVSGQVEAC